MIQTRFTSLALLSLPAIALASCGSAYSGDSAEAQSTPSPTAMEADAQIGPFAVSDMGTFAEPWAAAFAPGTHTLFITEKAGTMKFVDTRTGRLGTVTGVPEVDYGGQGGLGDIAFLPSEAANTIDSRTIYLSWAEAGAGDTRGAVVGRGQLACQQADACTIEDLAVIWRQAPKVTGRGHYSHRIAFSPDERYMYVASGDRQKQDPAQDTSNTLGTIVRLNLDGSPAANNPVGSEIWSYGHRNILGLAFDDAGRLWDLEHGPAGGDELNLVERGVNYGWPVVSNGDNYNGTPIPDNDTRPDLRAPVFGWTPVIAPGDMIFYSGSMFGDWSGDLLIAGLKTQAIIHLDMEGTSAEEIARYDFGERLREIVQGPDGAIYVLEDGDDGRLRKLTPSAS
ncbi:PQQ-dependent sugar dehydrogenase [Erythrobacter litoralis]|uniref:Dehydrogenase n=1 Tax=Erythrobacter litoralis (strain HTCC2594) TaxID=314225 RepID=Q2NCP6_ERYLH|nr:PQQ-dependent sugar dehydrogenase [Erythrobacter litoralis]ABC62545.1 dehydrogenase [Erythrobacter litoralis HTCC2594]